MSGPEPMQKSDVLWLLILVLWLRAPDLFWHFRDWDEAAMMAQGWALTRGQVLYKDIFQFHAPLNILLFAPFFRCLEAGVAPHAVKAFNLLLIFGGALAMRRAALAWLKDETLAFLAALLFVLPFRHEWTLSSYGEFYALFPLLLSLRPLFFNPDPSPPRGFMAGLLWAGAFFFKQTAVFDAAALCLGFLFFGAAPVRHKARACLAALLGALSVSLAVSAYFASQGALSEAARSILIEPLFKYSRLPASGPAPAFFFFLRPLAGLFAIPALAAAGAFCLRTRPAAKIRWRAAEGPARRAFFKALLLWAALDLLGVFLIGREHLHYLIPLISPLALLAVFALRETPPPWLARLRHAALAAAVILLAKDGWAQWRELRLSGGKPPVVRGSEEVSAWIKNNTREEDTLFLYGIDNLDIFYLSGRLSNNGVYMFIDMMASHMNDPLLEARQRARFLERPPAVLAVNASPEFHQGIGRETDEFFMGVVRRDYVRRASLGQVEIYFRKAGSPEE